MPLGPGPGIQKRGVVIIAQQVVQLDQLAALAFPAHPDAFAGVVKPAPVQQIKPIAIMGIAGLQRGDSGLGVGQQVVIIRLHLARAIQPVAQQGKADRTLGVGQIMQFQIADQIVDVIAPGQKAGDHDQCAGVFRHTFAKVTARQPRGRHKAGGQKMHKPGRCVRGGQQGQHEKHGERSGTATNQARHRPGQNQRRQTGWHSDAQPAQPATAAQPALAQGRAIAALLFKVPTPRADQRNTGVAVQRAADGSCHLCLAALRAAGQAFNFGAVLVARQSVQHQIGRILPQDRLHPVDPFEPVQPIGIVNRPQRPKDVADRDIAR